MVAGPTSGADPLALAEFQEAGVRRAIRILERYRGVLIADPTGSGKTFVALSLIQRSLGRGRDRVLVTGPAALHRQWLRLLRSTASTLTTFPAPARLADGPAGPSPHRPVVGWTSHTALSLGRWPAHLQTPTLVVVDEAHAFRNPRTRRYRALARLCRSAQVVLLTATPVHNSLLDLYFQLRLFLSDEGLAHLGVPDLRSAFLRAAAGPGPVPESLRTGVDRVCIRRSRKEIEVWIEHASGRTGRDGAVLGAGGAEQMIEAAARQESVQRPGAGASGRGATVPEALLSCSRLPLRFPVREPPGIVPWGRPGSDFRRKCAVLEALELKPFGLGSGAGSGAELMRFHLLKRLESSEAAFSDSLKRLTRYFVSFLEALEQGFLLRPDDRRAMSRGVSDAQLFMAPLALRPLPLGIDRSELADSVSRDLEALRGLAEWKRPDDDVDPKVMALDRILSGPLADLPVLVFSEFRATAVELWRRLAHRHRAGLIHGGGAWLGLSRASRSEVVRAFAPLSNAAIVRPASRIRVLFATDVLSEGWNLQDARDVVSFDLPWNPVRLMQRLGRIDRLGSPHSTVRCHNFMPDQNLDDLLGLVDRLRAKLDAIRTAVGDPGPILNSSHIPEPAGPPSARTASRHGRRLLASRSCRAADRLRARLLRLLVREPGGAGAALCERADRLLEFLRAPQRIGVEFELEALESQLRVACGAPGAPARSGQSPPVPVEGGAAGLLDRLEAVLLPVRPLAQE